MEKMNRNELLNCNGGNFVTTVTSLFFSFVNVANKLKALLLGGRR